MVIGITAEYDYCKCMIYSDWQMFIAMVLSCGKSSGCSLVNPHILSILKVYYVFEITALLMKPESAFDGLRNNVGNFNTKVMS